MTRVAIVSGVGNPSGLGFAIALHLLQAGYRVMITATSERIFERLRDLSDFGNSVIAWKGDLTSRAYAEQLVEYTLQHFGTIDVLVNNAGMAQTGVETKWPAVDEIQLHEWNSAFNLSVNTCFNLTSAVLPHMKRKGFGRIINMSSVSGTVAVFANASGYCAAKAAIVGYTRALALELAPDGITANAIAPGWIDNGNDPRIIEFGKHSPIGRAGKPAEIASLARYLASDEASYLTGQSIVVDGGNTIQECHHC